MLWSALVLAISLFLSLASPSTPATTTSPHPAEATQCFPHLRAALGLPSASTNLGETVARSGAAASTTIGGTSTEYQVDADGFLVKKVLADGATWKYVWDAHGQLSEVERPNGQRVAFTYDAFGRRTSKTAVGVTTEYVWDGDDLVHERVRDAASGSVVAPITTWVFEPGTFTPLAKLEGRKRYGVVTDHLGSPSMLATEAGQIAWRAQLDVYGVPREEPGVAAGSAGADDATANPWRFPGQYEDAETGLYYNRFRYYDPDLGRYLSEDPIGVAGGVALFGYVHEPLAWVDWFGLTGAYFFTDGTTSYIGKGPVERMKVSMKERIGGAAKAAQQAHLDFGDSKMALMVEHELMKRRRAVEDLAFANKNNSPGKKLLEAADDATKKLVGQHADDLEKKFKASCK